MDGLMHVLYKCTKVQAATAQGNRADKANQY